MHEVYEFLKQCGVYYLATVEGDQPRVRPFGTVDVYEGRLYIQTGKKKPVAHQMKTNPKVELSGIAGENGSALQRKLCWMKASPPKSICWQHIRPCRPCTTPVMATPRSTG